MRKVLAVILISAMFSGCMATSRTMDETLAGSAPSAATASPSDGGAAQAVTKAGYTELYTPVSVGVSYIMSLDDLLQDTIGYDIAYTWRINREWDVEVSAGYERYDWEDGYTKSQVFPVMVTARYTRLLMNGAAWYMGLGAGYSLNDPVDMDNSLAGRVVVGMTQPMDDRSLVGLEIAYHTSKSDIKWLGEEIDLTSLQARLTFIYTF